MSTSEGTSRPAIPKWSWWIVWMLFLATVVNYLDRQTLISTADHVLRDFRLDKVDYGWVEMSFGLSYAIFLIVAINLTALGEALTLAKKAGLDRELTLTALAGGLAGSKCLDQK